MKKKAFMAGLCICLMLSVTGCKGRLETLKVSEVKEETVLLRRDGSVQSGAYETFDKSYYKEDELKSFMKAEIEEYNQEHGEDKVKLTKLKIADNGSKQVAKAIVTYQDVETFSQMNNIEAAQYTMEQAVEANVFPEELTVAADGSRVGQDEVVKNKDYKVLVIQIKGDVLLPDTVKYYKNAMLLSSNKVEATGEELAVIVYK